MCRPVKNEARLGAQTLVRDFFAGFFILLENQYTVGDVVDVGTAAGTVEHISLRVTVLRDLEGVVHYIPNGNVQRVSNKTKEWSRVLLEISVAYGEDIDRVLGVLNGLLDDIRRTPPWDERILDQCEVAGSPQFSGREGRGQKDRKQRHHREQAAGHGPHCGTPSLSRRTIQRASSSLNSLFQGAIGVSTTPSRMMSTKSLSGRPASTFGNRGGPSPPFMVRPWQDPQSCLSR